MKKLFEGNLISLLIVQVICFMLLVIYFNVNRYQEAKEKLETTKVPSYAEYIAQYDAHVYAIKEEIKEAKNEKADGEGIIMPLIVGFVLLSAFLLFTLIQLLISTFVVDKIRKNNTDLTNTNNELFSHE